MKKKQALPLFFQNFLRCGVIGWCMEIVFTSLNALRCRDFKLKGNTSIWMFPIYGCAALFGPVSRLLTHCNRFVRGLIYMSLIFCAEFTSGKLLSRHDLCPWDYQKSPWNIKRLIRLDYAPLWFGAGLLFEQVVKKKPIAHP